MKAIFLPALLLCVLLLSFCLTGCRKEPLETSGSAPETIESEIEPKGVYHKLTPKEAYDMMQAGGITVVDVRTKALLIYCRSGRRSRDAAEKLIALGYENVYDFGGINDWPYETVTQ